MRRVLLGLLVGGVTALSCSRVGDDRFPKLPDAAAPDATDFVPDAPGPIDAPPGPDAAPDAA